MNGARRARASALLFLALAALAIASGVLYAALTPAGATGVAVIPAAIAFVGAAILVGLGIADLRYARRLSDRKDS